MTHIEDCLLFSLDQAGDRYVFGAEVGGTTSDKWDCSELVEVACRAAGLSPTMPDGAFNQWQHCRHHGLLIPVDKGTHTRGALLFVGDGTGVGRDAITHVAWSLGDGTTIEARGTRWGVGTWPTAARFDFAGLVPGADYTTPKAPLPPAPRPQEDDVIGKDIHSDRRGRVISAYFSILGRKPTPIELAPGSDVDKHVIVLVQQGDEAMQLAIAGSEEGRAALARA